MRSLAFWGLAVTTALAPATADAQRESGRAWRSGDARMAPAPIPMPTMPLHAPAGALAMPPVAAQPASAPRIAQPVAPSVAAPAAAPPGGGWTRHGWSGSRPLQSPVTGAPHMAPPPGGWRGEHHPAPSAGAWAGGQRARPGSWQSAHRSRPGGWVGYGNWGSRPGWGGYRGRYQQPRFGRRLPAYFIAPAFFINDWGYYGLGNPGYGRTWVRYYDDAVLVERDGRIVYSRTMDWDRDDYGYGDYDDDGPYGEPYRLPPPAPGAPYIYQAPPGSTTVVIQSAPTVTTTTTTTEYVVERVVPRHRRTVRRARVCACR